MLLAIDIGNTNTVFAAYDGDDLVQSWRCQSEASRGADEYASFLNQLFPMAGVAWGDITAVIVSSVVPEANFNIRRFCEHYLKQEPLMVTHDLAGVPIDLPKPDEVGADRLVNAAAVIAHYSCPAIVIDFGTATTFDVISAEGHYAGGVIAPGIRLSMTALHQATAKLPDINVKRPEKAIGTGTVEAMQAGVYWGYMGLIERIISQISQELEAKPSVIATGGLASFYAQDMDVIDCSDPDLTLKGLLAIYKKHQR